MSVQGEAITFPELAAKKTLGTVVTWEQLATLIAAAERVFVTYSVVNAETRNDEARAIEIPKSVALENVHWKIRHGRGTSQELVYVHATTHALYFGGRAFLGPRS